MKKRKKKPAPPCPDPERYVLVKTKERDYWRKKRGTDKPAVLNRVLAKNVERIQQTGAVGRRMVSVLEPYLRTLYPGRLIARINGTLIKWLATHDRIEWAAFQDFDFQAAHPMSELMLADTKLKEKDGELEMRVKGDMKEDHFEGSLVTNYYFEAVILWGDPEKQLRVASVASPLYGLNVHSQPELTLSLPLPRPGTPWMAMLKVNSNEGNEMAVHGKYYGMKVVGWGANHCLNTEVQAS
jgi:hypothetical protein